MADTPAALRCPADDCTHTFPVSEPDTALTEVYQHLLAAPHPGLAEPLAALLEIEAERGPTGAALRVAQVVLGEGGDIR